MAFAGSDVISRGTLAVVALACKAQMNVADARRLVVYDDDTGFVVDIELSGSLEDVQSRYADSHAATKAVEEVRGRGRPRLGVVSREISLLPRHWDWLAQQRGGASATLRRLVDAARKREEPQARARQAVEAAHRFLWDAAGDLPGFEEATRALFAHDMARLEELTASWPLGIREQLFRYLKSIDFAQVDSH